MAKTKNRASAGTEDAVKISSAIAERNLTKSDSQRQAADYRELSVDVLPFPESGRLFYDVETRSRVDLKKVGAYCYAEDKSTELLCVAYALDDGPVKLWTPGQPVPKEVARHIESGGLCVAHNAAFERQIHTQILGLRHGWPVPQLAQYRCTMAASQALALPGSLEGAASAMSLDVGKDKAGKRVMMQMTKPRKARKGEDANEVHWYEDDIRAEQLYDYCKQDVSVTRDLYHAQWQLSAEEQHIWEMDQRINDRGFHVDEKLLLAMRQIINDAVEDINKSTRQQTGGAVDSVEKVAALKAWLQKNHGIKIDSLDKKTVSLMLADPAIPARAKAVLELRLAGAQAAVKKVGAFLSRRDPDGRVRGAFVYHAAGTGRWASRGAQVHNLKRLTTEDQGEIAGAVDNLMSGDYKILKAKYARPLQTVGDNIRACIDAAPGNVLIGADFRGIEARITAWLAGEERKLQVFRDYDAGKGPDPYEVTASGIYGVPAAEITKPQRQVGKGAELAFGFGGGVNAYKKFVPDGAFTDEEIDRFKNKWRKMHPNIVNLWSGLKYAGDKIAKHAVQIRPGIARTIEPIPVHNNIWFEYADGFMFIVLPSGRRISYPAIDRARQDFYRVEKPADRDNSPGPLSTCFMDNSSGRWYRVFLYGGLICENVVQGTARDLLAEAMVRIEKAGLPIVAHVHDEVVIEVPEKHAHKVTQQFSALMTELPDWAQDTDHELPVVASCWQARRYVK